MFEEVRAEFDAVTLGYCDLHKLERGADWVILKLEE